jgi:hypothetical protein
MYYQLWIFIGASLGIDILIPKYKGEGEKGCKLSKKFVCRSGNQLHIFIGEGVGIDILILKYKVAEEDGCGLSETFVMHIKEWGSASSSVRLFLKVDYR